MSDAVLIALITGAFGAGGVGILKAILDYRRDTLRPNRVTTDEAAQASALHAVEVTNAPAVTQEALAEVVRAMRDEMDRKLKAQSVEHEREIQQLRNEMGMLRRMHSSAIRYISQLREDLAANGITPRAWPTELNHEE